LISRTSRRKKKAPDAEKKDASPPKPTPSGPTVSSASSGRGEPMTMGDSALLGFSEVADKLRSANELKEAGNEFFRNGEYQKAVGKYTKVFAYTSGLKMPPFIGGDESKVISRGRPDISKDESSTIDAITLSTNLNLAACYVKLKDGEKAFKFAEKAVAADQKNPKAFFRRGQAWQLKGDFDNAEKDLKKALDLAPTDALIKKTLAAVRKKLALQEKEAARRMSGMFSKTKKATPS